MYRCDSENELKIERNIKNLGLIINIVVVEARPAV
jgi:hypothetical protein